MTKKVKYKYVSSIVVFKNHRNRHFKNQNFAEAWVEQLTEDEKKIVGEAHCYPCFYDSEGQLDYNECLGVRLI
jgi:hypothetical protein